MIINSFFCVWTLCNRELIFSMNYQIDILSAMETMTTTATPQLEHSEGKQNELRFFNWSNINGNRIDFRLKMVNVDGFAM